ncbi:MAG TPA: dihydroxy-acid dehydratase, partial [Terriglobales bacterium]
IEAIKAGRIQAGDVLVLAGRGPMGSGMEETYQLTSALKFLPFGKHVALITDARFSGVSTGACIGHVAPEALAGGPIGKLRDGDSIDIVIDPQHLDATINVLGDDGQPLPPETLAARSTPAACAPDPALPEATRLWAALQNASGGPAAGCVYDTDKIIRLLQAGQAALDSFR